LTGGVSFAPCRWEKSCRPRFRAADITF
jgi:hypothetical protein